jgi:S1-C subfamily serine protease
MKHIFTVLLNALVAVAISYACSFAQNSGKMVVRQMGDNAKVMGEPFNLAELGSIVLQDSAGLRVAMVAPKDRRPKAYQEIDLREGDLILMCNGKKVATSAELTKTYDEIKVGDKIQIGVKRDGQLMVVSFDKADPATLPARHMMIMKSDDGKGGAKIKMDGKDLKLPAGVKDVEILGGLGLMIGAKDGLPVIAALLPPAKEKTEFAALNSGDFIVSVSGKPATSVADVTSAYKALKPGGTFTFKTKHAGAESEISVAKPDDATLKMNIKK